VDRGVGNSVVTLPPNDGLRGSPLADLRSRAQAMYDSGDYTVDQIVKAFKTTSPTIYRALDSHVDRQEANQSRRGDDAT
jgi:hypothetical protein